MACVKTAISQTMLVSEAVEPVQGKFVSMPPSTATRFIVVRHGESIWNREGRIQGHLDSPLDDAGVEQAEALAARLSDIPFDALVSSDLGRASTTAQHIARRSGHTVVTDTRLRERHYGIFQGLTRAEARRLYPEVYLLYNEHEDSNRYVLPRGESTAQCFARNLECLQELAEQHQGGMVVVVTHGGVLDGLYRFVMNVPHESSRAFSILNASLNWFTCEDGRWRLDCWGDIAHLGSDKSLDDV